jgi:hypothetical protein
VNIAQGIDDLLERKACTLIPKFMIYKSYVSVDPYSIV